MAAFRCTPFNNRIAGNGIIVDMGMRLDSKVVITIIYSNESICHKIIIVTDRLRSSVIGIKANIGTALDNDLRIGVILQVQQEFLAIAIAGRSIKVSAIDLNDRIISCVNQIIVSTGCAFVSSNCEITAVNNNTSCSLGPYSSGMISATAHYSRIAVNRQLSGGNHENVRIIGGIGTILNSNIAARDFHDAGNRAIRGHYNGCFVATILAGIKGTFALCCRNCRVGNHYITAVNRQTVQCIIICR